MAWNWRELLDCGDGVCAVAAFARERVNDRKETIRNLLWNEAKAVTTPTPSPHSKTQASADAAKDGEMPAKPDF